MDGCEIPPIRTEFLELFGEGAFGKVHKATLMDSMAYFEDERDWACRPRKQKIVAVKELFGEFTCGNLRFLLLVAKRRLASIKTLRYLGYLRTKMIIYLNHLLLPTTILARK